jgi:ATP/maltotriose-dependent transcriptional regulator MalT
MADVPSRMAIIGARVALLPERWGGRERCLIIRQEALIGALTALFDTWWEDALAVPGLEAGDSAGTRPRDLLLGQLARGARDDQIARALGLSLRTVRRRIATLFDELGVDSRFQAGVEAVRRGLL